MSEQTNPVRQMMLDQAISMLHAAGSPLDLASVAAVLPENFDLRDDSEFHEAIARVVPAEAPPPETAEQPSLELVREWISDLRIALQKLSHELRPARAKLATALGRWQNNGRVVTHADLVREHIASEQRYKADVKAGRVEPKQMPTIANSMIDRVRAYSKGPLGFAPGVGRRPGQYPAAMKGAHIPPKVAG